MKRESKKRIKLKKLRPILHVVLVNMLRALCEGGACDRSVMNSGVSTGGNRGTRPPRI
jgi:hypothetical protein